MTQRKENIPYIYIVVSFCIFNKRTEKKEL